MNNPAKCLPPISQNNTETNITSLANQLYEGPTHFLLELIQNANDNKFNNDEPTLDVLYKSGYIHVQCNEAGFSPSNVTAICNLGKSSKKQSAATSDVVGEKGIGFKSVFRVADVVWISSRAYNFKFDATEPLGMITPSLADFPVSKTPDWTSIYLQLRKGRDSVTMEQKIQHELEGFDARLLLFLKKLKKIKVGIDYGVKGTRTCVYARTRTQWNGHEMINLTKDNVITSFLVYRHKIDDLPTEERRPGATSTELVLVFPVDENKEPIIASQQVFAFLPIHNFGFSVSTQ